MALSIPADVLDRLWPHASPALKAGMVSTSAQVLSKFGILTLLDLTDFLAQISEETGGGIALSEDLHYSSVRLTQVWPRMFPSLAAAAPFAQNPQALAAKVYGQRYGNRLGTDDGWNYRGRGLIQLTFRANYEDIAKLTGLDLLTHPDLVCDPLHALECAAAYWQFAGVSALANKGDFQAETVKINGGLTNYPQRVAWKTKWAAALTAENTRAAPPVAPPAPFPSPAAIPPPLPEPAPLGWFARILAAIRRWITGL